MKSRALIGEGGLKIETGMFGRILMNPGLLSNHQPTEHLFPEEATPSTSAGAPAASEH